MMRNECQAKLPIFIDKFGVVIGAVRLIDKHELDAFAYSDGFDNWQ